MHSLSCSRLRLSVFTLCVVVGSCSCGKFFPGGSSSSSSSGGSSGNSFVYVANNGSQNISAFSINSSTGTLTALSGSPFSTTAAPNLLTIDPQNKFLFAGLSAGGLEVFALSSGALSQVASGGSAASGTTPLALAVTPNGSLLFVVDSKSTSVSAFSIGVTGALTAAKGTTLTQGTPEQGLTIDSGGTHIYVPVGTAGIFTGTINSDGSLTQTSTVAGPAGTSLQQTAITPSGAFFYALDPANGVAAYSVSGGALTLLNGGKTLAAGITSSAIAVDPTSKIVLVANSGSGNVSSFTINSDGTLLAVAGSPFAAGTSPQALTFDSSGKFVYVAGTSGVTAFTLDSSVMGKLDSGSSVAAGADPVGIAATH